MEPARRPKIRICEGDFNAQVKEVSNDPDRKQLGALEINLANISLC